MGPGRARMRIDDDNILIGGSAHPAAAEDPSTRGQRPMHSIKRLLQASIFVITISAATQPSAQSALSAEEIMQKVDFATRKAFKTQIAHVKITTCRYKMVAGAVKCSEKPRSVIAENAKKVKLDGDLYSDRQLSIVREPASDKGTGLLVYEYGERGRDNDNWLYLPALGKVNRVIANDDEGGSVFGSEFSVETTENPEARKFHEYTYKLLEDTKFQGRNAWMIELTPTAEKARKTKYGKVVVWIDKESFITLKEDLYRGGRIHKQRTQSGIRRVDGIYVSTKVVMNNMSASRVSQMDKMSMRHDVEIDDEYLTQRSLTDFAFRERNLARFRTELSQSKGK